MSTFRGEFQNIVAKESESGKHTPTDLYQILTEKIKTTNMEEFNAVLTELAAMHYISMKDGKVWSALNPPKP